MFKTYFRILSFGQPVRWVAISYLILILCANLFNLLTLTTSIPLLETLFSEIAIPEKMEWDWSKVSFSQEGLSGSLNYIKLYIISGKTKSEALLSICLVLVFSAFFYSLFSFLSQLVLSILKSRIVVKIRREIYRKILTLDVTYFSDEKKGELMSKLTTDIHEIEATAISGFNRFIKEPIVIIISFTFLFVMQPSLTLFTLLVLPLSGILIGFITKQLRRKASQGQKYLGTLLSIIDETISGIKVIRAFNAVKFLNRKFTDENKKYGRVLFSMDYKKELASPISYFLGFIVVGIILYKGGTYVFNADPDFGLSGSELIAYLIVYSQIIPSLKALSNGVTYVQRGIVSAKRVFDILDQETRIKQIEKPYFSDGFENAIEFKNVSFAYNDTSILNHVDLTVRKGEMVALVGPSGGGKSTLMDLIPRFHDPAAGQIFIDDTDIKSFSIYSLRSLLGVVTQEAILFNDSVYNNIAFGKKTTLEEVIEAAKVANAHEFIQQLENGYDTNIGDRGMKLSGGQRQRLTIARAVLKNPPILLLDEATSALDSESERLVQDALNNLMKSRTSIVIAHRLSTIQHADKIVVIEAGKIVEQGSHQELLELKGLYYKLQQMQATV